MNYMLQCSRQAGYDSFDALVSDYYTANFKAMSMFSNTQRLSRRRRLPGLLVDLREKAETWTKWEALGYVDETVNSAEKILLTERREFLRRHASQGGLNSPLKTRSRAGSMSAHSGGSFGMENSRGRLEQGLMTPDGLADTISEHQHLIQDEVSEGVLMCI
jgi:hypothetical protein